MLQRNRNKGRSRRKRLQRQVDVLLEAKTDIQLRRGDMMHVAAKHLGLRCLGMEIDESTRNSLGIDSLIFLIVLVGCGAESPCTMCHHRMQRMWSLLTCLWNHIIRSMVVLVREEVQDKGDIKTSSIRSRVLAQSGFDTKPSYLRLFWWVTKNRRTKATMGLFCRLQEFWLIVWFESTYMGVYWRCWQGCKICLSDA